MTNSNHLPPLEQTPLSPSIAIQPLAYVATIGAVAVTVGLAFVAHKLMPHANLSLLFLTSVLIISARTGMGPSLLASILSFLAFNFFFTTPYYTFYVVNEGDVATLIFFLIMAAITGNLAARMHQEMTIKQASLRRISILYDFSHKISSAIGAEDVLDALTVHLEKSLDTTVGIMLPRNDGTPVLRKKGGQATSELTERLLTNAWSQAGTEPITLDQWQFLSLISHQNLIGMVVIRVNQQEANQIELASSLCSQATVALDRLQLISELAQARLETETEQLRSALLSSVSHDLRTPLASIIGSITSLIEYGAVFSDENRQDLLKTVHEEARRLDRHIQNLLDMTRLGQGTLTLHCDWVDLQDIIASAVQRLKDTIKDQKIDVDVATDVPLLWVHGVLLEQVLINLLDNALRFSSDDGRIVFTGRKSEQGIEILVCNDGLVIPENEREKIFDMFYSANHGDRGTRPGAGLGLTICRGMIAAHGGTISVQNGTNHQGTCMKIALPFFQSKKNISS